MHFNRGTSPEMGDTFKWPTQRGLVLVQIQDADGFWANWNEPKDISTALKIAALLASQEQKPVRVVKGLKREIVRVIEP